MEEKNPLQGILSFAMSHPELLRTAVSALSLFSEKGAAADDSFLDALLKEEPDASAEEDHIDAASLLPVLATQEQTNQTESFSDHVSQNRRAFLLALKPYLGKGRQARLDELLSLAPILELFLEGSGP